MNDSSPKSPAIPPDFNAYPGGFHPRRAWLNQQHRTMAAQPITSEALTTSGTDALILQTRETADTVRKLARRQILTLDRLAVLRDSEDCVDHQAGEKLQAEAEEHGQELTAAYVHCREQLRITQANTIRRITDAINELQREKRALARLSTANAAWKLLNRATRVVCVLDIAGFDERPLELKPVPDPYGTDESLTANIKTVCMNPDFVRTVFDQCEAE